MLLSSNLEFLKNKTWPFSGVVVPWVVAKQYPIPVSDLNVLEPGHWYNTSWGWMTHCDILKDLLLISSLLTLPVLFVMTNNVHTMAEKG
jgi:hypothetical protein